MVVIDMAKDEPATQYRPVYLKKLRRRTQLRWGIAITYIAATLAMSLLLERWEAIALFGYVYLAIVLGGAAVVIAVVVHPVHTKRTMPVVPDERATTRAPSIDLSRPYHARTPMTVVYWSFIPLIVLMAILSVVLHDPMMWLIGPLVIGFLVILQLLFGTLEVRCDADALSAKFSFFGPRIDLRDIVSIRPVAIRPLRDFMGYGIRVGPDGAKGIISQGKVGVRVERADETSYVITAPDPQYLSTYVRAARAAKGGIRAVQGSMAGGATDTP